MTRGHPLLWKRCMIAGHGQLPAWRSPVSGLQHVPEFKVKVLRVVDQTRPNHYCKTENFCHRLIQRRSLHIRERKRWRYKRARLFFILKDASIEVVECSKVLYRTSGAENLQPPGGGSFTMLQYVEDQMLVNNYKSTVQSNVLNPTLAQNPFFRLDSGLKRGSVSLLKGRKLGLF